MSMVQKSEPLRVAIGDPMIWFGFINTRRSLLLDFLTIKNLHPVVGNLSPDETQLFLLGGYVMNIRHGPFLFWVCRFSTFLHCKVLWLRRSFATMR